MQNMLTNKRPLYLHLHDIPVRILKVCSWALVPGKFCLHIAFAYSTKPQTDPPLGCQNYAVLANTAVRINTLLLHPFVLCIIQNV